MRISISTKKAITTDNPNARTARNIFRKVFFFFSINKHLLRILYLVYHKEIICLGKTPHQSFKPSGERLVTHVEQEDSDREGVDPEKSLYVEFER